MIRMSTTAPVALPEVIAEAEQSGPFLVTPVRQLFDQIMKVVDIVHAKDLPRGTSSRKLCTQQRIFRTRYKLTGKEVNNKKNKKKKDGGNVEPKMGNVIRTTAGSRMSQL